MENLNKIYTKNKNLVKVKQILKTAEFAEEYKEDVYSKYFRDLFVQPSSLEGIMTSKKDRENMVLECNIDMNKEIINYTIAGFGGEVNFEKEIPEEALLECFNQENGNPIILETIQEDIINISKAFNLEWKYEIEKILK